MMDHDGICRKEAKQFIACIKAQKNKSYGEECKRLAAAYMQCRMDNGLMDKEPLSEIGLPEINQSTKEQG